MSNIERLKIIEDDIEYEVQIYPSGDKHWYLNKIYHRENGPALECLSGNKAWYNNGLLHRENGPAVEYSEGYRAWHLNGKLHRIDGPAVVYNTNWIVEYWIDNIEYTKEDYDIYVKKYLREDKLKRILGI